MFPLKQSTALTVPFFAFDTNGDAVTGKVTGDWTKRISKASGAFAAMTVTITEKEGGWYDLVLDTGHTNTIGLLSVYLTCTGVKQVNFQWPVTLTGIDGDNITHIDGLATAGNNATLNLKQLNVVNTTGSAIVGTSNGSNGHGMILTGNGSGEGISTTGGTTGVGFQCIGSTGFVAQAAGSNGNGASFIGIGTGEGFAAAGGATGHGMELVGGATSGDGFRATVTSGIEFNALPSFIVQADGGNAATQVKTNRTESNNDNWIGSLVVIRDGVLKGQVVKVSDYDGTTKILTFVSPGFTATPANGVTMSILNQ